MQFVTDVAVFLIWEICFFFTGSFYSAMSFSTAQRLRWTIRLHLVVAIVQGLLAGVPNFQLKPKRAGVDQLLRRASTLVDGQGSIWGWSVGLILFMVDQKYSN